MSQPSSYRYCGYCGSQIDAGLRFCPNCGHAVYGAAPAAAQPAFQPVPQPTTYSYSPPPMASQPKRPVGIIIVSILWILGGLYNFFGGLATASSDASLLPDISSYSSSIENWLSMALPIEIAIMAVVAVLGIMQFVTVPGLLSGKRWSYKLGLSIPIIAFITVCSDTFLLLTVPGGGLAINTFSILISFVSLSIYTWYLRRPHVKAWLKVTPPTNPTIY